MKVQTQAAKGAAIGFWKGVTYPFKGMHFVFVRHPSLIRIWIFPILITLLVFVAALWGVWEAYEPLVEWLWSTPTGEGFWESILWFLHEVTEVLAAILGFVVAFLVTMLVSPILAAPFNGKLSEQVERLVTGRAAPPSSWEQELRFILRSVGLETLKLGLYLVVTLPLWILSFLFPPFGPVGTALGYYLTAMHAAVDFTDSPQERRRHGVLQTYTFAFAHHWPMLGFGTGVFFFLFVPFLNLLFLPAVVAGGTLLYLDITPDDAGSAEPELPAPEPSSS